MINLKNIFIQFIIKMVIDHQDFLMLPVATGGTSGKKHLLYMKMMNLLLIRMVFHSSVKKLLFAI